MMITIENGTMMTPKMRLTIQKTRILTRTMMTPTIPMMILHPIQTWKMIRIAKRINRNLNALSLAVEAQALRDSQRQKTSMMQSKGYVKSLDPPSQS